MPGAEGCPLCGRPLRRTRLRAPDRLVTGEGPFRVWACESCRFGCVAVPELERYYGGAYFESFYDRGRPASLLERARARYRAWAAARRFRRTPFAVDGPPGRVLDVGCGSGELLAHYAAGGWRTFGIEPSPAPARLARERGATVHAGTLADHPWPSSSFELVVFSHSLEHIPEPLVALRAARELLVAGGRLVILAPNWRCWQRRLFRSYWFPLDLPRHVNHFSPRALAVTAERLQLEPVAIGTSSTIIAVPYSLHYLLAGRWHPGWRLWLAYAAGLALYPLVLAIDRILGGDACYAILRCPANTL
jgi:SAM-dependent methyltransferase